jgi:phage terminase large subunit
MSEVSETVYISSASGLEARLTRICSIIEALELRMVSVGVSNSTTKQYMLDDGQTKIQTEYNTPEDMAKAIIGFEKIKQKIINQLNGRVRVLRPWRGCI